MKEIAVFANKREYSQYIVNNLEIYFSKYAKFNCYDTGELDNMTEIKEEYVVLSAFTIYQKVKKKVSNTTRLLVIERTMRKSTMEELKNIEPGTRALLVNMDYVNCIEVINMIYGYGIRSIELIPFYPGCDFDLERDGDINLAITAGESKLVPAFITSILDFGERAIDIDSIHLIAEALNVKDVLATPEAKREADGLVNISNDNVRLLNEKKSLFLRLSSILRIITKGIIITDISGRIYMINELARDMIDVSDEEAEGFNVAEVLPQLHFDEGGKLQASHVEEIIQLKSLSVMVTITAVEENDGIDGKIIMMEYFNEVEDRQHKFRRKLTGSGHKAKYTFSQINGNSKQLDDCKQIAKRLARTDSSICIYGESGTGKELFAQSIHNESDRRKYSFVAINCSALPENLLESELYGYEEGAFSGASKGGKIGLFELAHRGTLFLDEIGELPMMMQAKLLRAIEEKQILRIGGRDLIDVDVRIISATNKDLKNMVNEGTFRQDLYYRLCVLPINIPPLRDRQGDILFLLHAFMEEAEATFKLTEETVHCLEKYNWPGNVREMRNVIEYLSSLGKLFVDVSDLPISLEMGINTSDKNFYCPVTDKDDICDFILKEILEARSKGQHIGRKQLSEIAINKGVFATEQEIRNLLILMNHQGYVVSGRGRKGTMITDKGITYIQKKDV